MIEGELRTKSSIWEVKRPGWTIADQFVEALRDQRPSLAHAGKCARPVQFDLAGLAERDLGGFDVIHSHLLNVRGGWLAS